VPGGVRRWPVHPEPGPGEALTSWLGRLAGLYRLSVEQLRPITSARRRRSSTSYASATQTWTIRCPLPSNARSPSRGIPRSAEQVGQTRRAVRHGRLRAASQGTQRLTT
jgi:hypothetical protein